jgi:hypothetical protein
MSSPRKKISGLAAQICHVGDKKISIGQPGNIIKVALGRRLGATAPNQ